MPNRADAQDGQPNGGAAFSSSLSFRDLVLIFFKFRGRLLAFMGICLFGAAVLTLATPAQFESDASILIKFGREFTYRPEVGANSNQVIATPSDVEEILNTEVQLLLSRDVVLGAIDHVGLARIYPALAGNGGSPDLERAVDRFMTAYSATPLRTSNIVQLSFRHHDPAVAQETLAAIIQVFRDKSLTVYTDSQTNFFLDQKNQALRRYTDAAARLRDFRTRYGAIAYMGETPLLLQQRADLEALASRADVDLAAAKERSASLRRQSENTPPEVTAYTDKEQSRVIDDAKTKLLNLRLRERELTAQFSDDSRPLKQVRDEIAIAEHFLSQQSAVFTGTVRRSRNETLIGVEQDLQKSTADLAALTGQTLSFRQKLKEIDDRIAANAEHEPERWALEQEVEAAQEDVKQFGSKLDQAHASDSLNEDRIGNVAVVQSPSLADKRLPVRPKPGTNFLIGLLAGIMGGVVIGLLSELASDTFYDPMRAERLTNVPVLAVFNTPEDERDPWWLRRWHAVLQPNP